MITWMQRHKRWLVITIWISTIAFVGAGFVGWGSYDYGKKQGTVAVVGDRQVSLDEYQREYSYLYEQYAKMFGEQFNQEVAKQLNLSDMAYNLVIQKNLILSYADELGLDVTNEDIVKELVQIQAFQKEGKFDKETYVQVLMQNRTNPTDFENSLKRDLLLQKIESIFKITPSNQELDLVSNLLFIEDNINVTILDSKALNIEVPQSALKTYWEANKNSYMSAASYEIETQTVDLINKEVTAEEIDEYYSKFKTDFKKPDGKIKTLEEAKEEITKAILLQETKKEALKQYIDLKKEKASFSSKEVVFENEFKYALEDIKTIVNAKESDVLKPFLHNDRYVIIKVNKKIEPQPLEFKEAYSMVSNDYLMTERQIQIAQKAKEMLKNFKGDNLGYVNRASVNKIPGLNPNEAGEFLNKLFTSSEPKGMIELGEKIVLYKINNVRFTEINPAQKEAVLATLTNLQNNELMTNLINSLENRYEIQSSLENKKDK
ncbi:MAG: SurA N-terminal domain-containing protein [Sulfurimonadaceae bacterium]